MFILWNYYELIIVLSNLKFFILIEFYVILVYVIYVSDVRFCRLLIFLNDIKI